MRILVTGASGFIGRSLITVLRAAGHEPVAAELRRNRGIRDLDQVEAVVHLAALAHRHGSSVDELRRVNVLLAEEVGRAASAAGIRMVFVSTAKVHGEVSDAPLRETSPMAPRDAYARSKAKAEELLRAVPGLRLTILRPPLVYGPCVKANFLALMAAVAHGMPLPLAKVSNRRSYLYVANLSDAIISCLVKQGIAAGRTYLLSDGIALSTAELCRWLGRNLGRPARLFRFPLGLLGLVPGGAPLIRSLEIDDSAIRKDLDWRPPVSLEEGLRATADWYLRR